MRRVASISFKFSSLNEYSTTLILYIFLLASISFSIPTMANNQPKLEQFVNQKLGNLITGIVVQESETGKILFEKNANQALLPASTQKLLVTAAALNVLGANYQYQTSLKLNPSDLLEGPNGKILKGNLFLEFSGDPSLCTQDLQKLMSALKKESIQAIEGNIVIDNTRFEAPFHGMGWAWNSLPWYFSAPVTSIILDENKLGIEIISNTVIGQKAEFRFSQDDLKTLFSLDQDVTTVTEKEATDECQLLVAMNRENNITVKGCWPQHEKSDNVFLSINNPDEYAKRVLLKNLKDQRIHFNETLFKVTFQKIPRKSSLRELAIHSSQPLSELIKKILQDSNNIYTESVFKTMGFMKFKKGSFQTGALAANDIVSSKFGIKKEQYSIWDGSGASRYNLLTANQLARVLFIMNQDKTLGPLFKQAMAVNGQSGTLKDRMSDPKMNGRITAKTGKLNNVTCLAGYLVTQKNPSLIFVIMVNNVIGDLSNIDKLIDEFCVLLVEN